MRGYLIYHPSRVVSMLNNRKIYHDAIGGNQDPYIWHKNFLHTYCHMTQMSPQVGDINFWVSGNTFPYFTELYCDVVFIVERKEYWIEANRIDRESPMVDNDTTYNDHYRWAMCQHPLKRRKRFTLKATAQTSFQPQNNQGQLMNIVPLLNELGLPLEAIQRGLRAGFTSKPMRLGQMAQELYIKIRDMADIHLYGSELESIRNQNPQLGSP